LVHDPLSPLDHTRDANRKLKYKSAGISSA
jgi:hypothetical protein